MKLQDRLNELASDDPIADRKRAVQIAAMDELTINEFRELTGIGIGTLGIYCISETGISVAGSVEMTDLTARQQHELNRARKLLRLNFPCSHEDFAQWYEATRGEFTTEDGVTARAPSDFPLVAGYIDEVRRLHIPNRLDLSHAVTSKQIIDAFLVKEEIVANERWWETRLRDPENYGLLGCRVMKGKPGRGGNPSLWNPRLVAVWLLEKRHLHSNAIAAAIEKHFPAENAEYFRSA